jgi:hypothetical protein
MPSDVHEKILADTTAREPHETLAMWRYLRDMPLPDRDYRMQSEVDRNTSAMLLRRMLVAGGVGVLGGSLVLAGLLYKPRPKARARRPAVTG